MVRGAQVQISSHFPTHLSRLPRKHVRGYAKAIETLHDFISWIRHGREAQDCEASGAASLSSRRRVYWVAEAGLARPVLARRWVDR